MVFYAEQNGEFFALRRIESHSGGISAPYSMTGSSVTLPCPPRPGTWRIFAIQEHSQIVYGRHLESRPNNKRSDFAASDSETRDAVWKEPILSNSIVVEFAKLDDGQMRSAEQFVQDLIEAEQYSPHFREPCEDPTRKIR